MMVAEPYYSRLNSLRLKGYNYSTPNGYFITICVNDRLPLFGQIQPGSMVLNDSGRMVHSWFNKLPDKFPNVGCGQFVVMPDHLHMIIDLSPTTDTVTTIDAGADPCVRHITYGDHNNQSTGEHMGLGNSTGEHMQQSTGEHMGSPLHIYTVVQWFKTMTTNAYIRGVKNDGWRRFNNKLWQRGYHDQIIWTSRQRSNIERYILMNPQNAK